MSVKKCLQKVRFPEQLIIKIMELLLQDKCLRVQNVEQYLDHQWDSGVPSGFVPSVTYSLSSALTTFSFLQISLVGFFEVRVTNIFLIFMEDTFHLLVHVYTVHIDFFLSFLVFTYIESFCFTLVLYIK